MALAKKCDRCGAFYTEEIVEETPLETMARNLAKLTSAKQVSHKGVAFLAKIEMHTDLCENCSNSLKTWWYLKGGEHHG